VRLAIDLHAELDLAELLREADDPEQLRVALEVVLPPSDVVMPVLSGQVGTRRGLEYYGTPVPIPSSPGHLEEFAFQLDAARLLDTRGRALRITEPYGPPGPSREVLFGDAAVAAADTIPPDGRASDVERALAAGVDLELLAWRRWRCASRDLFLDEAITQVVMLLGKSGDPQRMSVLGALAAFAGHERSTFHLVDDKVGELQDVFRRPADDPGLLLSAPPLPSPERLDFAVRVFGFLGLKLADPFREPRSAPTPEAVVMLAREAHWQMPEHASLLFLLLTPEPLEMLVRRVTGIPDKLPL
jgi:hypothetical protein